MYLQRRRRIADQPLLKLLVSHEDYVVNYEGPLHKSYSRLSPTLTKQGADRRIFPISSNEGETPRRTSPDQAAFWAVANMITRVYPGQPGSRPAILCLRRGRRHSQASSGGNSSKCPSLRRPCWLKFRYWKISERWRPDGLLVFWTRGIVGSVRAASIYIFFKIPASRLPPNATRDTGESNFYQFFLWYEFASCNTSAAKIHSETLPLARPTTISNSFLSHVSVRSKQPSSPNLLKDALRVRGRSSPNGERRRSQRRPGSALRQHLQARRRRVGPRRQDLHGPMDSPA